MCVRYLGFVLLVWFPGVLRAQDAVEDCDPPILDDGYFVPEKKMYYDGATLMYACDNGHKPAVEGWWGTSICENGNWSPAPQCIDEKACFPPIIPNAQYPESSNGWYEDGYTIRITCDKGYKHKGHDATAKCTNGAWSTMLACEKRTDTCGEPPKIPHAVIIHQTYQEVFPVDSEVQYECEAGYTVEGAPSRKNIFCIAGNWSEGPTCSGGTGSGTSHGGSTDGRHTAVSGSGRQPLRGATDCSVDTDEYFALVSVGVKIIQNGESEKLTCVKLDRWWLNHYSLAQCTTGRTTFTPCCNRIEHLTNSC